MRIIGKMLQFLVVATVITSVLILVVSMPRAAATAENVDVGFGIAWLVMTVLFVMIPFAILWPFTQMLGSRINIPRPLFDVIGGAVFGVVAALLLGTDGGGLWNKAAFLLGGLAAGWTVYLTFDRKRAQAQ